MPQAAGTSWDCVHSSLSEIVLQILCLPNCFQSTKIPSKTLQVTSDSDGSLFMRTKETNSKLVRVQRKYLVQFQLLLNKINWSVPRRLPRMVKVTFR